MNRFQTLLESPQNELVEQAVSDGRIPIGYSCSFVPEAFLMADKLMPVRLHAPGVAGTEIADIYLSNFICTYTRSLLEFAVDDRFDLIQGWVFVPSCAHMQRLYDNLEYLNKPEFSHVLDMPRKVTEATLAWQVEELTMLADKLSVHFGVDMSDDSLMKAITEWNNFAEVIQSIGELRKNTTPTITGTEFHTLLMAALVSPKNLILPKILDFQQTVEKRDNAGEFRARLMVMGSHLHDPEFIKIIESQGGLVVADLFCTGSITGFKTVEMNGNPIKSLAEHSLKKTLCPRMMEDFDRRLKTIIDTVKEYKVDGVVIEIIKFCDLWGVDSMPMVSALRKEGIPVLKLEREYSMGGEGQLRTRVQAFIESMGK
ncbi:MAG: 2-hydroxyacyl-CoA dehydratase family protein [Desulfobacteraceae bacterium]|jgi:benzoyl-CoA reductase/2-hydroxyglutaryl-CoA dehydratase subunit BcrC/BadD/HgdB|nr:2-hydroxyacyl-CoA dehydratase family protein [Desulfobacteraceae bacterium]